MEEVFLGVRFSSQSTRCRYQRVTCPQAAWGRVHGLAGMKYADRTSTSVWISEEGGETKMSDLVGEYMSAAARGIEQWRSRWIMMLTGHQHRRGPEAVFE
jgi:hypothetical protein